MVLVLTVKANLQPSYLSDDICVSFGFFKGYVPMKGDWVQAKYLIDPLQWTSQVQFVAPLRYCRLDQVMYGLIMCTVIYVVVL